jgi:hypothetical protein
MVAVLQLLRGQHRWTQRRGVPCNWETTQMVVLV